MREYDESSIESLTFESICKGGPVHTAPCTQLGSVFDMHSSLAAAVVNESKRNWQLTEPTRDDRIELIVSTITVRNVCASVCVGEKGISCGCYQQFTLPHTCLSAQGHNEAIDKQTNSQKYPVRKCMQ